VQSLLAQTANPEAPNEVNVSQPSDVLTARAAAAGAFDSLLLGLRVVAAAWTSTQTAAGDTVTLSDATSLLRAATLGWERGGNERCPPVAARVPSCPLEKPL
jgi:hypothetical protein